MIGGVTVISQGRAAADTQLRVGRGDTRSPANAVERRRAPDRGREPFARVAGPARGSK